MQFKQALSFLGPAVPPSPVGQQWADLGCGSGLFTRALLTLLPDESIVHAIDKRDNLETAAAGIRFLQADFVRDELPFGTEGLDGLLMANSLHYVKDKRELVERLKPLLKPGAGWVVIEYETVKANPWVPFPIPFEELERLFLEAGYATVNRVGEQPSIYQGMMYCARVV